MATDPKKESSRAFEMAVSQIEKRINRSAND